MKALVKRILEHCHNKAGFVGEAWKDGHYTGQDAALKLKKFKYPPATETELKAAERVVGMRFPPLLRSVYKEVSNGHFGPSYGLYGIPSGKRKLQLDMLRELKERREYWWPIGLIPMCYYGCTIVAALYIPDGRVVMYDYSDLDCDYVYKLADSLEQWFEDWMTGNDPLANDANLAPLERFP